MTKEPRFVVGFPGSPTFWGSKATATFCDLPVGMSAGMTKRTALQRMAYFKRQNMPTVLYELVEVMP
jgi:hypothetical protein